MYESTIAPWWLGFSGKWFRFYFFKHWLQRFLWILYHYCNEKTLFSRNYIVFEMDFSTFSSSWEFFDAKSLPNFLRSPTIIFIIFRDFLIFCQIFFSPQVKRCAIIPYKHGTYEVPHKLPNDLRLRKFLDYQESV